MNRILVQKSGVGRKAWFLAALSLLFVGLATPKAAEAQRRGSRARPSAPQVAVVVDGPSDATAEVLAQLAGEANALLGSRWSDWTFPTTATHVGDWTQERATALIAEVMASGEVDVVIPLGIRVGRAVGQLSSINKPVILPFAAPEMMGLPRDGDGSGNANLAYLGGLMNLPAELRRFREVIRRDRAVMLLDALHLSALEDGATEAIGRLAGDSMHLEVVAAGNTVEAIMNAIPEDAEAVYIGTLVGLPASQRQPLIDVLNARRLPTYAADGRWWVEHGAFVTMVPADELQRRLRRVALLLEAATMREDLSRSSTAFASRGQLLINMATARRIRVWPRFELMTEAELIGDDGQSQDPVVSLREAVRLALAGNRELQAVRRDGEVAEAQVRQARGRWLPTVDAQAGFTWLDPDVASPLGNAERTLDWSLRAQQVVYSPMVHGGLQAQRENVGAAREGIAAQELDIIEAAAQAYLNVLRTGTAERINRDNLQRVRSNLALAEVRVDVGAAGRQEVFRWEIEIASGRSNVIAATAQRNQAEIEANRVMNRGLEDGFETADPMDADTGVLLDESIGEFVEDPWSFRIFRAFMVQEAIQNAPELRQLDHAIAAQGELLTARRRRLYIPDVVVQGGFSHTLARGGEGSEDLAPMPGLPIAGRDDFTWNVGAALSFRLFDDTRYGEIDENEAAMQQLIERRANAAQRVEQRVRSALHQAGASSAAMMLRRDAATAAGENLGMVTEAYRQGTATVVTLIDAQSQALQSELAAANAVYDFLVDFVAVERASGSFGFERSEEDNEDFRRRLAAFAAARRAEDEAGDER